MTLMMNKKRMNRRTDVRRTDSGVRSMGILGGGQLARMLTDAAHSMGLRPVVYTDDPSSPAAKVCRKTVSGRWGDPKSLRDFLESVDVAVYENEFIDTDILRKAAQGLYCEFQPAVDVIRLFQNKIRQKELLVQLDIPCAPFIVRSDGETAEAWVKRAFDRYSGSCVMKWAQGGYDGKGVFISTGGRADRDAAVDFCRQADKRGIPLFAEPRVDFRRELALVACYSRTSEFSAYPLVISEQDEGICFRVQGPAVSFGVSAQLDRDAREYARRLAEKMNLYGCFALELFETSGGELWVNEIAPRVHNSGHYTMDAAKTAQFENHWRAVLGWPLGPTDCPGVFAMQNLLGPAGCRGIASRKDLPPVPAQLHLHWYDKDDLQPRRKMGHLNATAGSPEQIAKLVKMMEDYRRQWEENLKRGKEGTER